MSLPSQCVNDVAVDQLPKVFPIEGLALTTYKLPR